MWIDKAATFALGHELGGKPFLDLLVEDTHTCYLDDRSHRMTGATAAGVSGLPLARSGLRQMDRDQLKAVD